MQNELIYRLIGTLAICLLAVPAHAKSLMQQVAGAWTLTSGAEQMPDGTKIVPWSAGNFILESDGPRDPRKPAGPMIA
jgi:hypothetical protein